MVEKAPRLKHSASGAPLPSADDGRHEEAAADVAGILENPDAPETSSVLDNQILVLKEKMGSAKQLDAIGVKISGSGDTTIAALRFNEALDGSAKNTSEAAQKYLARIFVLCQAFNPENVHTPRDIMALVNAQCGISSFKTFSPDWKKMLLQTKFKIAKKREPADAAQEAQPKSTGDEKFQETLRENDDIVARKKSRPETGEKRKVEHAEGSGKFREVIASLSPARQAYVVNALVWGVGTDLQEISAAHPELADFLRAARQRVGGINGKSAELLQSVKTFGIGIEQAASRAEALGQRQRLRFTVQELDRTNGQLATYWATVLGVPVGAPPAFRTGQGIMAAADGTVGGTNWEQRATEKKAVADKKETQADLTPKLTKEEKAELDMKKKAVEAAAASVLGAPVTITLGTNKPKESGAHESIVLEAMKEPMLGLHYTDLTSEARNGRADRYKTPERILEEMFKVIGSPRLKCGVITAEKGIGKSVAAKVLAREIARGNIPESVRKRFPNIEDFSVISLDASNFGASLYVGSAGARANAILKECNDKPIILFVDEMHRMFDSETDFDALKGAMADGKLIMIGASTEKEWDEIVKKYYKKDEAIFSRIRRINMDSPPQERWGNINAEIADLVADYGITVDDAVLDQTQVDFPNPNTRMVVSVFALCFQEAHDRKLTSITADLYSQIAAEEQRKVDMNERLAAEDEVERMLGMRGELASIRAREKKAA